MAVLLAYLAVKNSNDCYALHRFKLAINPYVRSYFADNLQQNHVYCRHAFLVP